jgi:large subunit ribosomal protein L6
MSKIGKQLIKIPAGVTVTVSEDELIFKSDLGEIKLPILQGVKPSLEDGILKFELISNSKQSRSNWGTLASLSVNAIEGLAKGFQKTLILEGVGYRAAKEGDDLVINVGFSHSVRYHIPTGVTIEVEKNTIVHAKGFDKALVGQVAAEIRSIKKPEPYKGTGIRYINEVVRRKAGKKAATTTAK